MTYNDIGTPIRKYNYGEADIIYSILTAHHGRVEAIAKGIRKSTSRKRGNIELGIFSSFQFAKGTSLDIITEAQMLEFNDDLLGIQGIKFLYSVLPIINKFSTDKEHSEKIFELIKNGFLSYEKGKEVFYELAIKYKLLQIQNLLPDLSRCYMCKLKYDKLEKYNIKSNFIVCNNCARSIEHANINVPQSAKSLRDLSSREQEVILNILNTEIKELIS